MRKAPSFGLGAVTVVASIGMIAGLAVAQKGKPKPPVLHEDLPVDPSSQQTPTIGSAGSGNPAAFQAGKKVVPKPPLDDPEQAPKGEPVLGTKGFAADRQTQMTPDTNTGKEDTLHYVSVFNPDVLPFKRMSAFEAVADNYNLHVRRTATTELPVGGPVNDRARDRFYGSVLIQLSKGKSVALPSVAPDMRILSYEVNPRVPLVFEKDGADNFFVRSDESSASGTYRLVFFADADSGYFAPNLPAKAYTPRTMPVPPELKPSLPAKVMAQARITLRNLRVNEDMPLGEAFNALVAYFRAFEAKTLPVSKGDVYRELCDSQAGVCRHRAFAFMITANALGIPTRFVENEAHAFVEVWFPERRWQRIDLGGAALRMEVTGADDKTLHRPSGEDPFAKPPEYKQNYTQLEGEINGLTQQQKDDKRAPLDQAPASSQFGPGAGSAGGTGSNAGGTGPSGGTNITPDPRLPQAPKDPHKDDPRLDILDWSASAYRGASLRVAAYIHVGTRPLVNHPIDVYIAPAGKKGENSIPLGRAVTGPDGKFNQEFTVPSSVGLAAYDIFLSSPEDAYFNAALSEE
ncbi:MAG: transglutaminase domain-containing protein [Deltaproteobacteria bacterium]|nr:transglutaminase domain-containing protein [Deltaproteobacteria bacterium]MCW5808530.1 transglutaminase domain-containing protein [Deltaproteobacteria bacterium]